MLLTQWSRATHICVSKVTINGSDNEFPTGRHQVIIWTEAVILLIAHLGTKFSEMLITIHTFSFMKIYWKYRLVYGGNFPALSELNWLYMRARIKQNQINLNSHLKFQLFTSPARNAFTWYFVHEL